jgi:thymidylate synthase
MRANVFSSANKAFRASLQQLRAHGDVVPSTSDPDSPGSHFGAKERSTKSLVGYNFKISEPRDRLVNTPGRRANPIFAVANALWILGGRDDLHFIQYYNPLGKNFSDDGETLYGAYGSRLMNGCTINQIDNGITGRIVKDRHTRRAFATIVQPRDTTAHSRDIPCLLSIQFHVTKNGLDMISTMRSQSAAMVMPYDLFALTFLHETIAAVLCIPLGIYHHNSGSFHYYLEEEPLVNEILAKGPRFGPSANPAVIPCMPTEDVWGRFYRTMELETYMRQGTLTPEELHGQMLPDYWKSLLFLLGVQTWGKSNYILKHIPEYYRAALL